VGQVKPKSGKRPSHGGGSKPEWGKRPSAGARGERKPVFKKKLGRKRAIVWRVLEEGTSRNKALTGCLGNSKNHEKGGHCKRRLGGGERKKLGPRERMASLEKSIKKDRPRKEAQDRQWWPRLVVRGTVPVERGREGLAQ